MESQGDGFIQDYQLEVEQGLWVYCRLCRQLFQVTLRPKSSASTLRCVCGNQDRLAHFDIFQAEEEAREHEQLYERIHRAANQALREAGLPVPPSARYRKVSEIAADSQFESYFNQDEDWSAIAHGYAEAPDSGVQDPQLEELEGLEEQLAGCRDPLARHALLTELLEWAYCRRRRDPALRARFQEACREDIALAPQVVKEAKRRRRVGEPVRLSFSSFKHLIIDLEEEGDLEGALRVSQRAARLGLKGYSEQAQKLSRKLYNSDS